MFWIICKKELHHYFDSLMAYVFIVLFLGFSGFFTWIYGQDVFFINQASLQFFFNSSFWTLFFFIPSVTMGLIADERKNGTLELLFTKPVHINHIIFGKFLAALLLVCFALLLTLPYYFSLVWLGKVDHGAILTGYLGLILMSAAYISLGIFTSSLTSNQLIALLISLFVGVFFHFIFSMVAANLTGFSGIILNFFSISAHFESISRGVIDSKDLIYFISFVLLGLYSTAFVLKKYRRDN